MPKSRGEEHAEFLEDVANLLQEAERRHDGGIVISTGLKSIWIGKFRLIASYLRPPPPHITTTLNFPEEGPDDANGTA